MKKHIGILVLILIAVGFVLGSHLYKQWKIKLGNEAFAVFTQYIEAARAHDIERLKALSHQVSPACADPEKEDECIEAMDSAVFFLGNFKREEYTHVLADEKQIVMLTDFHTVPVEETPEENRSETVDELRYALFFTRGDVGPKVLGFNFCFRDAEDPSQKCFDTRSLKHDENDNDWWDEVEKFFK